jgi:hypothetical protein
MAADPLQASGQQAGLVGEARYLTALSSPMRISGWVRVPVLSKHHVGNLRQFSSASGG